MVAWAGRSVLILSGTSRAHFSGSDVRLEGFLLNKEHNLRGERMPVTAVL
jgi:hypothetical protein